MSFALTALTARAAALLGALLAPGSWQAAAAAQQDPAAAGRRMQLLSSVGPLPACGHRILAGGASAGDRAGLVLIEREGLVHAMRAAEAPADGGGFQLVEAASCQLANPYTSLLDFGDVTGDGQNELVVVDARGASYHGYSVLDGFGAAERLARRARNPIDVGVPRLLGMVVDVVGDARADLILPGAENTAIWSQAKPDAPQLRRTQSFPVDASRSWSGRIEYLTDRLRSGVRVPPLDLRDLNGDDRPDLIIEDDDRFQFHLQDGDGQFAEAPIELDLSTFVDTTPEASIELGETLVSGDDQQLRRGDVNGDGIPDYVIGHRRKVWTFLGTSEGPQFRRPSVVRVGTDISAFVLVDLNEDGRSDLLLFRLEVPSAASLAVGLVSSIDIDVRVVGHAASERGRFSRRPLLERRLTLRTPAILSLLDRVDELADRLLKLVSQARFLAFGELDGKGGEDVAVVSPGAERVDVWPNDAQAERDLPQAQRRAIKRLLFEDRNTVFDIDRVLDTIGNLVDARAAAIVGQGTPAATMPLRDPEQFRIIDMGAGDFDGDGRDELLIVYEDVETGTQRWFDVVGK